MFLRKYYFIQENPSKINLLLLHKMMLKAASHGSELVMKICAMFVVTRSSLNFTFQLGYQYFHRREKNCVISNTFCWNEMKQESVKKSSLHNNGLILLVQLLFIPSVCICQQACTHTHKNTETSVAIAVYPGRSEIK